MKRTPGYLLQHIAGTDYLLPYGQLIADHRRGISLNHTGAYVWKHLEREPSREELRREYLKHFYTEGPEEELTRDLDRFLDQLISLRLIEDDVPAQPHGTPCAYLEIGGLTLSYSGARELIDATNLSAFRVDPPDRVDQRVSILWGPPPSHGNGTVLVRDPELVVCERERDYLLLFPTFTQIHEVSLSKDSANVVFYCKPPINEALEYQFFHALRLPFLYLAATRGMYAIHSASLLYRDRAWLFSASSGTGKSTHVNLWRELYQTAAVNGDLNLLAIEDGKAVIRGIPWCGTSEIFDTRTLPLGGIILLKRGMQDTVEELSPDQKALLILQRFISPMWTASQLEDGARFAQELSGKVLICWLRCTKEPSAAQTVKEWIDHML